MRKRIIVSLFFLLTLIPYAFASYEDEIRYQGLEWGSSVSEVKEVLKIIGLIPQKEETITPAYTWNDFDVYFDEEETVLEGTSEPETVPVTEIEVSEPEEEIEGFELRYYYYSYLVNEQSIAGHKLHQWNAHFCKISDDWQFYLIHFAFEEQDQQKYLEAYEDLKTKLNTLYGEGLSQEGKVNYYWGSIENYRTEWEGLNNTGIRLLLSIDVGYPDAFLWLDYGKTDDSFINAAYAIMKQRKAEEEARAREEEARAKEELARNYTGL